MQIKDFILRKGRLVLLFSLFLTFTSFTAIFHPYYISVTEIRIDAEKKTVNMSCKMFTDDLQNALNRLYAAKIDLVKRNALCDSLINLYVKERLEVSIGVRKADFKFIGFEIEEEAAWCYFEAKLLSDERNVKVTSSILYDFIESQTNFLHCYYNNERKSFKLENPNKETSFRF